MRVRSAKLARPPRADATLARRPHGRSTVLWDRGATGGDVARGGMLRSVLADAALPSHRLTSAVVPLFGFALAFGACARAIAPSSPAIATHDVAPSAVVPASAAPSASAMGAAAPQPTVVVAHEASAPLARRSCGESGWITEGHDAARTAASDGCCEGPLRVAWHFLPAPSGGRTGRVHHAIADGGVVYAAGLRGDSPVLHRLDETGAPAWTFDSRADIHRDDWPSIALGSIVVNDDGLYLVDPESGKPEGRGLDSWGASLTDGTRMYAINRMHVEGPGLFLAAYDASGKILWKRDKFNGPQMFQDEVGGIALDAGVLFHSANYNFPAHSFVAAVNPATGDHLWTVTTMPESAPSAAGGRVFGIESIKSEHVDKLVARAANDGSMVWSREVSGARGPSPALAADLVIVHGDDGVLAFDAATGAPAWTAPISRAHALTGHATTLAAALGSATLVVTAGGEVHVLSLADGAESWSGRPMPTAAGAAGATDVHSPILVGKALYVVADGELAKLVVEDSLDRK